MGLLEKVFGDARGAVVADLDRIDYVHGPRRNTAPLGAPYHPANPDNLTVESFDLRKTSGGAWEFVRAVSPLKGGTTSYDVLSRRETVVKACEDLETHIKRERRLSVSMLWRALNDGAFYQPDGRRTTGAVSLPAVRRALASRDLLQG